MDTKTLIAKARARFNHNSAKAQLKDKYDGKLIVADQGGLWKADKETINFLYHTHLTQQEVILIDTFNNPVKVNALALYQNFMMCIILLCINGIMNGQSLRKKDE